MAAFEELDKLDMSALALDSRVARANGELGESGISSNSELASADVTSTAAESDAPPPHEELEPQQPGQQAQLEEQAVSAAHQQHTLQGQQAVQAQQQAALPQSQQLGSDSDGMDENVDWAIKQALQGPERVHVLRIEEAVQRFVRDPTQELLEFPANYSNYQRMLAHKVAQHYKLQTNTVDFETGHGRVVARRTNWTSAPKVALADLNTSSFGKRDGWGPKAMLRRPCDDACEADEPNEGAAASGVPAGAGPGGGSPVKSHEEREQEYLAARERIIGGSQQQPDSGIYEDLADGPAGQSRGAAADAAQHSSRGSSGGYPAPAARGMQGYYNGGRGSGGVGGGGYVGGRGGGGGKALYRDRQRDLQDPEYRRGPGTYGFQQQYAGQPMQRQPGQPALPGQQLAQGLQQQRQQQHLQQQQQQQQQIQQHLPMQQQQQAAYYAVQAYGGQYVPALAANGVGPVSASGAPPSSGGMPAAVMLPAGGPYLVAGSPGVAASGYGTQHMRPPAPPPPVTASPKHGAGGSGGIYGGGAEAPMQAAHMPVYGMVPASPLMPMQMVNVRAATGMYPVRAVMPPYVMAADGSQASSALLQFGLYGAVGHTYPAQQVLGYAGAPAGLAAYSPGYPGPAAAMHAAGAQAAMYAAAMPAQLPPQQYAQPQAYGGQPAPRGGAPHQSRGSREGDARAS